jgi:hypothetical protein
VADFPKGWYPSPNVADHDQWWNGTAWTPHTQPASGAQREAPPAGAVSSVGAGTLPTAVISLVLGAVSLFANPLFILSAIAVLLGAASVAGIRNMPWPGVVTTVVILGAVGIALGVAGAISYGIALF